MSSASKTRQLLIARCRSMYSWAAVTRDTPSAIEWHRKDLETVFAEINGLMARLRFQDEAERCRAEAASPSLSPKAPWDPLHLSACSTLLSTQSKSWTTVLNTCAKQPWRITLLPVASCEPVPDAEHQPMASQWAAIRNLREETTCHHKRFQQLCQHLGDPTVSKSSTPA
jgi:hypothetical protein